MTELETHALTGEFKIAGSLAKDVRFFSANGEEILKITEDGEFYVHGRLVETDKEVYDAFRSWLPLETSLRDAVEAEREACARICDDEADIARAMLRQAEKQGQRSAAVDYRHDINVYEHAAILIRERGKK